MGLLKRCFVFLFCLALLAGCGATSSGSVPVISNLVFNPSSATINQGGGQVIVTATLDFIEVDGDLNTFTITDSSNKTTTGSIAGASGVTSGSINISVTVLTNVSGNFSFSIKVTDAAGHSSNSLVGIFTVN